MRRDNISGTNFRPGLTNIKGSDGLPLRRAILGQMSVDAMVDIKFHPCETKTNLIGWPIHETKTKYGLVEIGPKFRGKYQQGPR